MFEINAYNLIQLNIVLTGVLFLVLLAFGKKIDDRVGLDTVFFGSVMLFESIYMFITLMVYIHVG